MDSLTHIFVPYAAFTLARRPRHERVAAAIGGFAPDLDALWAWLSHAHELAYPLVHRGFSHTLVGAPLLATLLLFLLSRPALSRRWKRLEAVPWDAPSITPLWLGAWSHLVLDGLTITGVPLLWPLDDTRFTLDWFFFGITYLLPVSLVFLIQIFRGRATDRFIKVGLLFLAILLVVAGLGRFISYPTDLQGGEDVTPGPVDSRWYVSWRNDTGVLVYGTKLGGARMAQEFFPEHNRTAAAEALKACESRPGYTPWNWHLWGLPVVNATRTTEGGWRVNYTDSAVAYAELHPDLRLWRSPSREASESTRGATCLVTPDGQADFRRDRGWIGS